MPSPQHFKPADVGGEIGNIQTGQGNTLYKTATLTWSRPRLWVPCQDPLIKDYERNAACVYAIVRNHGKSKRWDNIHYIGITERLDRRFDNHPAADGLRKMRGPTSLSVALVDFGSYRSAKKAPRPAIEEIEHILIWGLWEWAADLLNKQKQYSLPGIGKKGARAWHIINKGYRFSGRMPREFVYPWILTKPGRDHSAKPDR